MLGIKLCCTLLCSHIICLLRILLKRFAHNAVEILQTTYTGKADLHSPNQTFAGNDTLLKVHAIVAIIVPVDQQVALHTSYHKPCRLKWMCVWCVQEAEAVPAWVLEELDQLQATLQARDVDMSELVSDMQQLQEAATNAAMTVTDLQQKVSCPYSKVLCPTSMTMSCGSMYGMFMPDKACTFWFFCM